MTRECQGVARKVVDAREGRERRRRLRRSEKAMRESSARRTEAWIFSAVWKAMSVRNSCRIVSRTVFPCSPDEILLSRRREQLVEMPCGDERGCLSAIEQAMSAGTRGRRMDVGQLEGRGIAERMRVRRLRGDLETHERSSNRSQGSRHVPYMPARRTRSVYSSTAAIRRET